MPAPIILDKAEIFMFKVPCCFCYYLLSILSGTTTTINLELENSILLTHTREIENLSTLTIIFLPRKDFTELEKVDKLGCWQVRQMLESWQECFNL